MKKIFSAALATVLAVSTVFSSLAATKLATPEVRWSDTEEGVPEWTRIEGASGEYQVQVYRDGELFHNTHDEQPATLTDEWLSGGPIGSFLEEPGIYTFRVMALGDGIDTLDGDWSAYSAGWTFEMPSVKFGNAANLRWSGTTARWDAPEIPEVYEEYFQGYEATLYGDGKHIVTYHATGKTTNSEEFGEWMDREGVEEYTFSVRVTSSKPSVIFYGDEVHCEDAYKAGEVTDSVSGTLDKILESGDNNVIANAPDTLKDSIEDIQVAMQSDPDVVEQVKALEKKYAEVKGIELQIETNENETGIDASEVIVTGALLNAAGDNPVTFNIRKPAKEEMVDAMAYKNSIQFDIHLGGAESSLKVPVQITIPVPGNVNSDFFRILHYKNGKLLEVINPKIENGMATFTVTSFSTFVFAEEGVDFKNVATPSNAAEFLDVANALVDSEDSLAGDELQAGLAKISEALRKKAISSLRLYDEEELLMKLGALLDEQDGAVPNYEDRYDEKSVDEIEIQRVELLSLATGFYGMEDDEEATVPDSYVIKLTDLATSSNASRKMAFDLAMYEAVGGEEKEFSILSPMIIRISVPEGYTYRSTDRIRVAGGKASLSYDEDMDCLVIYTTKLGSFTISGRTTTTSSGGGSGSRSVGSVNRSPAGGRWVKSGSSYRYYYDNGSMVSDCWLEIEWNNTKHWYYFNRDGIMAVGWLQDAQGNWFYLNPSSTGVYGSMVTGWNLIDGKWYYFNEKSDGFKGMMLSSTTTPDGYVLGADGAWIQ